MNLCFQHDRILVIVSVVITAVFLHMMAAIRVNVKVFVTDGLHHLGQIAHQGSMGCPGEWTVLQDQERIIESI
jgi:hypothetical protein